MLEIEMLHTSEGDKKKKLDTTTTECRIEVQKFIERQIQTGTALFLERGKDRKTYRVTGYDPKKDKLLVRVEKRGLEHVAANSGKGVKTAVPPRAGG